LQNTDAGLFRPKITPGKFSMEEIIVWTALGVALLALFASLLIPFASRTWPRDAAKDISTPQGAEPGAAGELDFLLHSLEALRSLANALVAPLTLRKVPKAVLAGIVDAFRPERAVVLVRRPPALSDPERGRQLILAEVWPHDNELQAGTVFDFVEEELFGGNGSRIAYPESDELRGRSRSRASGLASLGCEILVPMMNGEECLGVIGLTCPEGLPAHGEVALETIVEVGALALHQASEIDQIRSVADVDWLTGILNKGAIESRLEALLARATKRNETLALFLFDIDHFKHYNDAHGHLAGDDLLRLLARSVKEHTRRDDFFGRFGGDEFLLIFPGRNLETAISGATNVLQAVRDLSFPFGEKQPLGRITVSGGVACFSAGLCSSSQILSRADAALYQAKHAGRDQVVAAAAPMDTALKLSSA